MKLVLLSQEFYNDYSNCTEILQKPSRPYVCLAVTIKGFTYAIPMRHHINHKNAFITAGHAGLDYTKVVVVTNPKYIDSATPRIAQHEFNALKGKEHLIYKGLLRYIALYKKALLYPNNPHYSNILQYSSLQYFNKYI